MAKVRYYSRVSYKEREDEELEVIVNSVTDDVEVLHEEIQLLEDEVTDLSI